MDALFATLHLKEVARVKAKNRKDVFEARVRHERARAEADAEAEQKHENSHRDLGENSTAEMSLKSLRKILKLLPPRTVSDLSHYRRLKQKKLRFLKINDFRSNSTSKLQAKQGTYINGKRIKAARYREVV